MVEAETDAATGDRRIILRSNASFGKFQTRLLLAVTALVMGSIAAGFAMLGLWPVVPFSGAEWLLLAYCFRLSRRACAVREVITIGATVVLLEKGRDQPEQTYRFQRAWLSLDWSRPAITGHPSRLSFRWHGKAIEVGRFLVESERTVLARELQQLLLADR